MARKTIVNVPALAVGLGLLWAGSALAHEGTTPAPGDAKPEKTARKVCRTLTPSGSRLTVRRCMSQADWDANENKSRDGLLKFQTDNQTLLQQAPRAQ